MAACIADRSQLDKIVQLITFDVGAVDFFGVGLGNFQGDIVDHALIINGVDVVPAIENLANFTTGINLRNGYLKILAENGEAINTVAIGLRANGTTIPASTQRDGLIFDHLAIGNDVSPIPVPAAVWLFGTALIGFIGYTKRRNPARQV